MKYKKIKIGVIFYGDKKQLPANERQFNDLSNILNDFKLKKYTFNGEQNKLLSDFKKGLIDIVLKNSYGRGYENDIEVFLENHKIPFWGSSAKSTFIGTSKFLSKQLFRLHRINVAEDIYVDPVLWQNSKNILLGSIKNKLGFPCIVKDEGGVDSRGLYLAKNKDDVAYAVGSIFKNGRSAIIEKYINDAYEVICMVAGNENPAAYEPVHLFKQGEIISGKEKDKMIINFDIPCKLNKNLIKKIKNMAIKAHQSLGCRTFSRADILIKDEKLYLLEVDVHPGFSAKSPTLLSAKYEGQTANDLFLMFYGLAKNKNFL